MTYTGARTAQFARVWSYWLGGKDCLAADREVGVEMALMLPSIFATALACRAFLCRAVRYLAGEAGIRQFLDIGTGFPGQDNTHEVAQRVAPECRIVYADKDPVVLAHARALLVSHPKGACDHIHADVREPDKILAAASASLDFAEPVGVMLLGVLDHVTGTDEAYTLVARLVDALAPGSFVAINHATDAVHPSASDAVRYWNGHGTPKLTLRSPEQIGRFFDGLVLLEPGVVSCSRWRPEALPWGLPDEVDAFCGLARKPNPAMVSGPGGEGGRGGGG